MLIDATPAFCTLTCEDEKIEQQGIKLRKVARFTLLLFFRIFELEEFKGDCEKTVRAVHKELGFANRS